MQGESLFKVIFLVLLVSCAKVSGWSCYDCYGSTCANIKTNPAVVGRCQTGFRCFTRLEADGVTVHNKGCFSHSGSLYGDGVNLDYDGCIPQKIDGRDQVLCLCRGEGCNADTKKIIKTTTQPTSPSPTTTTSTTTSPMTTTSTTTSYTTTSTKSPPIMSKPAISTTGDGFFTVAELGITPFNDMCLVDGVLLKLRERRIFGCTKSCICLGTNFTYCEKACPDWTNLPVPAGCQLRQPAPGKCCKELDCSGMTTTVPSTGKLTATTTKPTTTTKPPLTTTSTTIPTTTTRTTTPKMCLIDGVLLKFGEKRIFDCTKICICLGSFTYCEKVCPDWTNLPVPAGCQLRQPAPGKCCKELDCSGMTPPA